MKILMVNKFLYLNGGAETYMLELGNYLQSQGHEVEYFGMEHENRCVGNCVNAYTSNMDFHNGSKISKITYPIKTIYSSEARKKIRLVLDNFSPDVIHLNNFNYQLTPSIILEICKWRKESKHPAKIISTAHDLQLVCPNHMMINPNTKERCNKCIGGKFINCTKGKCIHGSAARSLIGTIEAYYWNLNGVYKNIDKIICCSEFLKSVLDTNPVFAAKTVAIHNFVPKIVPANVDKKDYVLYFGRFSEEKGIRTLVEVCKQLPHINFVFAGSGPLENLTENVSNIKNVGFKKGEELNNLIRRAKFSVYPSECFENCPFSVMESQMYGTPVIGANIGGIPELIQVGKTGELFESCNEEELKSKIESLWYDEQLVRTYTENCKNAEFDDVEKYCDKILKILK